MGTFDGGREKAPAAICRKVIEAKINNKEKIDVWGDGTQTRSFLFIDDCIDAIIKLADIQFSGVVNVSSKSLTSIRELAELIKDKTNFKGLIKYDVSKLSGQKQRIMDSTMMDNLNWSPHINLDNGIAKTVKWFFENRTVIRER